MSDNRYFAHSIATLAKHLLQPDFAVFEGHMITCPVISTREEQQRERSVKSSNRIKKQLNNLMKIHRLSSTAPSFFVFDC